MRRLFWTAFKMAGVTLLITGVIYPLAVTALAQGLAPAAANGSWVTNDHGEVTGSVLIGQAFESTGYFHSRPPAAGASGYDAAASGGSNSGPTSKMLRERTAGRAATEAIANPGAAEVPRDLITTSASGLDPDITPEAAVYQARRIAINRGVSSERVMALVDEFTQERQLGFLGEPRVNVLQLNRALDRRFGQRR